MYKVCKVALIGKSCMSKFSACLFPTLARSHDQGQGHVTLFLSKVTWPWPWSRDLEGGGWWWRQHIFPVVLLTKPKCDEWHETFWSLTSPYKLNLLCFRVRRGYSYAERLFNNLWRWVFKKYIFFPFCADFLSRQAENTTFLIKDEANCQKSMSWALLMMYF